MAKLEQELEAIEIKDYSVKSGIGDDLTSKDSLINDFKFTEALEFDQQFEGISPTNFLPGSFNSVIDLGKGFEIKTDPAKQVSYFQTKNFERNQTGWQLDSFGNITATKLIRTAPGSKRVEIDGTNNRINFFHTDNTSRGPIEGDVLGVNMYSSDGGSLVRVHVGTISISSSGTISITGPVAPTIIPIYIDPGIELGEQGSAPPTPAATLARLYLRDNGAGKQQLVIKWDDGVITTIVTQP